MTGPLTGITIIELASWMFVPSAGAVLVDQGATVIKVESLKPVIPNADWCPQGSCRAAPRASTS